MENVENVTIEWEGKRISIPFTVYIEILMEYSLNFSEISSDQEEKIKQMISPFVLQTD